MYICTRKPVFIFDCHLQALQPTQGNTEAWRPLHVANLLSATSAGGATSNVFLISDGHLSNESATLREVRKAGGNVRVFTLGIGYVTPHIINSIVRNSPVISDLFNFNLSYRYT